MGRLPPAALAQLAGAVLLLGGGWPLTRYAILQGAASSWVALGRAGLSMAVGAAALLLFGRVRRPGRGDVPAMLAIGLLQLAAFFAFAHAAVAWVPAGRTAVLCNATIIWTVPLSLLLGEAIPAWRWVATGLGSGGILVMTGPWAIDWTDGTAVLGHLYLLGASASWAVAMVVVRRWPPRMSMFALLPWAFAVATAALLPLALTHGTGVWTGPAWAIMLVLGLVVAPLGTWCVVQATAALPLVVASVGLLAGPALGVLLSAAVLDEPLTPDVVLGTGLILGGAAVAAAGGRVRA